MGRKSTIDELPDEVRVGINEKLEEGFSLDQILRWLSELGHEEDVSRSALGRYKMKQDALSGELRRSREVAAALAREIGDDESQAGRVAIEMLHAIIMKMSAATLSGSMPDFDAREIHFLGRSLKDMMVALDIDDKRRAVIREKALKDAADVVGSEIKSRGLSPEMADEIRRKILGVDV